MFIGVTEISIKIYKNIFLYIFMRLQIIGELQMLLVNKMVKTP